MNESVDWRDTLYAKSFDKELRGLERRRNHDPSLTPKDLEKVLDALYIMDGADMDGRLVVQGINMAASIAAYEHFIAQWKAERRS